MMSDEHGRPIPQDYDGEPLWLALPKYWIGVPIYEWNNRTWWGKLKFPLWLLMSAFVWMVFTPFLLLIYGIKGLGELDEKVSDRMPDTHKDD